ncbi:hypothetical protein EW146_g1920 [Bondarzewia mesenterica]|uniref:Thioesterase domain-containing protein n=1 Tax=Bondarzewia mesenterica TaxID=1095465 RepID=A0A4S4M3T6_9AGAM|nr:hypothetical protein EW146_g1920 [Bondarzewia mesenterica]
MSACLHFTRRLNIHHARPGVVEASLKIEPYNGTEQSRSTTVHGGLILSLTDTLGSLALATKGQFMTGVSTDIGASFVKPAGRPGDVLNMTASLTAMGKSLAFTRVDFTNSSGDLVAYGHHTKYIGKSIHHSDNVKFSEDGEKIVAGKDVD